MTDKLFDIEIVREVVIYENRYGRLHDDEVVFQPSGQHGAYVRWVWTAPFSIAVLPIVDGHAILLENFRHAARRMVVEVPKGFGAASEAPYEAARRELREETGLDARVVRPAGVVTVDPAFSHHPMYLFIAEGCRASTMAVERSEVIARTVRVNLGDQANLGDAEVPMDAVTSLLLSYARNGQPT